MSWKPETLALHAGHKGLAIHPASTTHAQLTEEEQSNAGVGPDFVRLSIGVEHIDDQLSDLDQALSSG